MTEQSCFLVYAGENKNLHPHKHLHMDVYGRSITVKAEDNTEDTLLQWMEK